MILEKFSWKNKQPRNLAHTISNATKSIGISNILWYGCRLENPRSNVKNAIHTTISPLISFRSSQLSLYPHYKLDSGYGYIQNGALMATIVYWIHYLRISSRSIPGPKFTYNINLFWIVLTQKALRFGTFGYGAQCTIKFTMIIIH